MSATSRQITRLAAERGITREEAKSEMQTDAGVLGDILTRMETIEARQSRPSPIHLRTWEEIERFAEKAARSGMVPRDYVGKPDAIVIAVQMGSELGLAPMQALQNIAVVNGRPAIWGDAMPALCRASGVVRTIREWSEGEGDALTFHCEALRKDDPNPVRGKFSVEDAKRAGLWKETATTQRKGRDGNSYMADSGPWYSYPRRMLQMRARGFCLRDAFPDVLKGLITAEEASDIPFAATGLTPLVEPEAEKRPPQKSAAEQWLDTVTMKFANANAEELDVLLADPDIQDALDKWPQVGKDRLQHAITEAIRRTREAETTAPSSEEEAP